MSGLWWKPTYKSHSAVIGNGCSRCIGADQARKIGSADPMAANGKPSKKIFFSGGVAAMSGIGRL
jgi:hypothetical protein